MRIAIGIFIAALAVTPALALESERPDITRWVSDNTDMPAAQVAIAGPENIYSVERLGSAAPTGEVIALVRAENLKASWAGPQGFGSWDAHILFDCKAERMRVIRSASYPEPNRQGEPKADTRLSDWLSPRPDEPGARLLAAACDAAFAWPLRAPRAIAKVAGSKPPIIEEAEPRRPAAVAPAEPSNERAPPAPAADDAAAAAKPAVELASLPIEQPITPATLESPEPVELAAAETLETPRLALTAAKNDRRAAAAAPRLRLAGLFSPFAKVASLGKRLFGDGTRLAGVSHGRPHTRHASLGEEAAKRIANFPRAGPGPSRD